MKLSDEEFDEFFAGRAPALRRTAFVIVRDWASAEDAVQTAFVKVYRVWPRLRRESLDAYVRRAVVNASISQLRRRRRESVVDEVPERPSESRSSDPRALMEVLGSLPAAQRAVLALRFLDDLSVKEVADLLAISEGTVKSHTSRGLSALRRQFGVCRASKG